MGPSLYYNLNYSSLIIPNEKTIENINIFSQYFLPYPISGARSIENNYENVFGSNWLGFIPLIFLSFILILSIFKKIDRSKILLILIFAAGTLWFYSVIGGDIDPDRGVAGRYMVPSFVFISLIFGFVTQKIVCLKIFDTNVISNLIKISTLIILLIFFFFALNYISPISEWVISEHKFKNAIVLSERYPLDKEGLRKDSIIVNTRGSWVVDYDVTPLHPFLGYSLKGEIDVSKYPQKPIKLIKELLETDYDVYSFKESSHRAEKIYLNYLVDNHNFVLKEYSKSFCKFELKDQNNTSSDQICLKNNIKS